MSDLRKPCIVALGGGGWAADTDPPKLEQYVLGLADQTRPRVCYVPTAQADNDGAILRFYVAMSRVNCRPSHLTLFSRQIEDLRAFVLDQDVIWVAGGNTANLLAIWRAHGLHEIFHEAWQQGVVLAGGSAGSLCWFEGGTTDSFGRILKPIYDGLGFLPGSHCPHYAFEGPRRTLYHSLIQEGKLAAGLALADDVAARYEGPHLKEVVARKPEARAYKVSRTADGNVLEEELIPRLL
ncbi:MAG: peptidase E [Planctomycetes bacterium]|nr:peptidase E [Planctomycetota bacterium]